MPVVVVVILLLLILFYGPVWLIIQKLFVSFELLPFPRLVGGESGNDHPYVCTVTVKPSFKPSKPLSICMGVLKVGIDK